MNSLSRMPDKDMDLVRKLYDQSLIESTSAETFSHLYIQRVYPGNDNRNVKGKF